MALKKKDAKPKKMGAPIKPIDWKEFDRLAYIQCTLREIAAFFDMSEDTVETRVKEKYNITFSDHIAKKRTGFHRSLRRKQVELAESGNATMQIWLDKKYLEGKEVDAPQPVNVVVEQIKVVIEELPEASIKEKALLAASNDVPDDIKK